MRHLLPAALLLALPSFALAQRDAKVPDTDPEVERKSFIVAPGFEVNLFASDPLLAKPIQMNFDPAGRLWVASSEVYPQIKPGQKADDKIVVLEDTDGDGKADKTTVFADGLLIPTGVEPGDGGAYVANSTEIVHLSASKPGGKADRTRILLSGFGTEDTHHIVHTFRWGPEQDLYFNQSIYIHSHIETPHGVRRLNAGGVWRFNPESSRLDVFARGWVNAWGHHFDRWGQSFVTDGAGGEGINHVLPGGYYMTAAGASRILHGLNPGSPKYCGLEVVSGRHVPDDWRGSLLTNDFRGHRVCRFVLQDDGATFASREQGELIKTNHPAFRPVDIKMGPDGAIYIADWYNPIIQHGEVDFRDPRRDHVHGRIWRVTAKGRPLVPRPNLVNATVPDLLTQLKSPEDWTRQQAKRVLKERGEKDVAPHLAAWVKALDPADPDAVHHRLEALWVFQALGVVEPALLDSVLRSSEPKARAAAVRVLAAWGAKVADAPTKLTAAVADAHPLVRAEAVRALAGLKSASAAATALTALDKPTDKVLDYALWLTVRELEPYWMPAFRDGVLDFGGNPRRLAFALEAVGSKDAVGPVVRLLDGGKVPKDRQTALWLLLARIGGPAEIGKVLAHAADKGAVTAAERAALVAEVVAGVQNRKVAAPPAAAKVLGGLMSDPDAGRSVVRLVGLWKLNELRGEVERTATADDDRITPDDRGAAFEAVAAFGDIHAKAFLLASCGSTKPFNVSRKAIVALAGVDAVAAANYAAGHFTVSVPSDEHAEVFAAFLSRKGGAAALAAALDGKTLPADTAKLGVRAVKASTQPDGASLQAALTKAGGLAAARKEPTADEVKAFAADALKSGDPARGEAVFRRKDLQCLACHGIGGAGGQVGPDMTSLGASAQVDYLVESLLLPAKAVKEGYHATRVVTTDDKVFLGIKVRESKTEVVLRTPEDKEIVVPARDIAESGPARSLMPDGLTDALTRQEFADLVRFLSELGKVGPYAPSKARVVRRWQTVEPTPDTMNLVRRTRLAAAVEADNPFPWSPVYTRVSGDLTLADLPRIVVWRDTEPVSVARFNLDVTAAGAVKLKFNTTAGLTLYVGPTPTAVQPETVVDLKPETQTVTLLVDRSKRTDDLRVEVEDVPGSPARVAVVGGK